MSGGRRGRGAAALLAAAALFTAPAAGAAQAAGGAAPAAGGAAGGGASLGALFELYSFSDAAAAGIDRLSLFTVPVAARVQASPRIALRLDGAFASGSLKRPDGTSTTISGLTDTRLSASTTLGRDAVVVTGLVVLPTGMKSLTGEQYALAGAVAADLLPFAVTHWGSGGGAGGSVALARPLGDFGVGASVGYVVAFQYEPLDGQSASYQPGDALRVNAAIDHSVGYGKGSLRLSYERFSDDAFDGQNLFRSGDRLEVLASYAFPFAARSSGIVYGGALHRQKGSYLQDLTRSPSRNLLVVGGGARLPSGRATFVPTAQLRVLARSDGLGQGYTASVGASIEWALQRATLAPQVQARFGSVDVSAGNTSGFAGFALGGAIRFGEGGRR